MFDFSTSSDAKTLICFFNSPEMYTFKIPNLSPFLIGASIGPSYSSMASTVFFFFLEWLNKYFLMAIRLHYFSFPTKLL